MCHKICLNLCTIEAQRGMKSKHSKNKLFGFIRQNLNSLNLHHSCVHASCYQGSEYLYKHWHFGNSTMFKGQLTLHVQV